jgi:hypothetical protein
VGGILSQGEPSGARFMMAVFAESLKKHRIERNVGFANILKAKQY